MLENIFAQVYSYHMDDSTCFTALLLLEKLKGKLLKL